MGGGVMVWVSTDSAYREVFASSIVRAKLSAEFALVAWAGWEVFLRLVLFSKIAIPYRRRRLICVLSFIAITHDE